MDKRNTVFQEKELLLRMPFIWILQSKYNILFFISELYIIYRYII